MKLLINFYSIKVKVVFDVVVSGKFVLGDVELINIIKNFFFKVVIYGGFVKDEV